MTRTADSQAAHPGTSGPHSQAAQVGASGPNNHPAPPPLKVAMIAGEASGDLQGAALMRAVRERVAPRQVRAWGCGGAHMRKAGVEIRYDCSPWGSIGIAATLANIPPLLAVRADMKRALAADPPDVLVLIDAGAFNVPIARWAKKRQLCPVFYYFPPGSWRRSPRKYRKPRRGDLADSSDCIVTPFPWSADYLRSLGARAHFVGHPLLDLVRPTVPDGPFYERFGLDPQRPLVTLMPGSRRMEVEHILPTMIGAAEEISRRVVGVQFALVLAPTLQRDYVEGIIRHEQQRLRERDASAKPSGKGALISLPPIVAPRLATAEGLTMPAPTEPDVRSHADRPTPTGHASLVICEDMPYDMMSRSDLIITKSGTSTLEAAILKKPMIIVYRGSALMAAEWALRKSSLKLEFIGMPNLLAQEAIFPELLQDDASPENIAEHAIGILLQPERLMSLKSRVSEVVRTTLGEPGGVARAAELLLETATAREHKTAAAQSMT
jgi:lipid-A-disaccharide synthase